MKKEILTDQLIWDFDKDRDIDLGDFIVLDQDWKPVKVTRVVRSCGILTFHIDTDANPYRDDDK